MTADQLDRLVAAAAPVRDGWVAGLDLTDAESDLMEEIMATTDTAATLPPEPPANPSPAGGDPRRFRLAVAVGLAAALLVGVVVMRSTAGNDDGDDVRSPAEPPITPMIADPPDGFTPSMVSPDEGLAPPSSSSGPANTWVYGDLTPTAITNDVVLRIAPSAPEGTTLSEPVTVRGAQGGLCSPGPNQCDFGNNITGVSWTEPSGAYVTVETRTFDATTVLAIAEGVVVDGDTVELGSVPAGVTKPPKVAELDDRERTEYMVLYSSPDGGSFSVSTRAVSEAWHVYDLWRSGPRDDAQVQGHDASVEDIDGAFVVTWEPSTWQIVEVLTNGVDQETALAFAETVRPATDAEWRDLQEVASGPPDSEGPPDQQPPDGAVRRQLADGSTEVWGWLGDDGGLCYEVDEDGSGSQLCHGDPAAKVLGVSPDNVDGEPVWGTPAAVGVAPAGTASIDGGEVTLGERVDGGRLFVWESSSEGEMPASLTFRDEDGAGLATTEVLVF